MALPPLGSLFRYVAQPLELPPEESRHVRLKFEEGPTLTGQVVDPKGRPVPEVRVEADEYQPSARPLLPTFDDEDDDTDWGDAPPEPPVIDSLQEGYSSTQVLHTDAQGRFTVRHRLPRPYRITCTKPGYEQHTLSMHIPQYGEVGESELPWLIVPADQTQCTIALSCEARLSGRVLRLDGQPLTSFTVNDTACTSPDGTFRLRFRLEPRERRMLLELSAPGFLTRREWVYLPETINVDVGDRALEEGRLIRVHVVDMEPDLPPGLWLSR